MSFIINPVVFFRAIAMFFFGPSYGIFSVCLSTCTLLVFSYRCINYLWVLGDLPHFRSPRYVFCGDEIISLCYILSYSKFLQIYLDICSLLTNSPRPCHDLIFQLHISHYILSILLPAFISYYTSLCVSLIK